MLSPRKAKIVNVVAKLTFPHGLDLTELSRSLNGERMGLGKSSSTKSVKVRIGNVSFMIYSSGKAICTGAKSEKEARLMVKRLTKAMKSRGFLVQENGIEFEVLNVVASVDLGRIIDVRFLAERLEKGLYEPEVFSGLIVSDRWTYLIFRNGKVNVVGMKSEKELGPVLARLHEVLYSPMKNLASSESSEVRSAVSVVGRGFLETR